MKRRRLFTLLEIMLGIALLTIAAGALGWRIHTAVRKKKFQTDVSRIQVQLQTCHHLALNTHADWQVVLEHVDNRLIMRDLCVEGSLMTPFQPKFLSLDPLTLIFNGEEVEGISFYCTSSGQVLPKGILLISRESLQQELKIPELFHQVEGEEREIPIRVDSKE
jgi:hypothetical protein